MPKAPRPELLTDVEIDDLWEKMRRTPIQPVVSGKLWAGIGWGCVGAMALMLVIVLVRLFWF
jgi:hypothetical protein